MEKEEDRIRSIMENMARGKDIGDKLIYDRRTKTVRPVSKRRDPDGAMQFTPEDLGFTK